MQVTVHEVLRHGSVSGSDCETDIDECASNPCQYGATCVNRINRYSCACRLGFTGIKHALFPYVYPFKKLHCPTQLIGIGSEALYREKLCTFRSGTDCEINVDDCASSPCENDGVCTDGVDSFTCDCGEDTMGLRCQDDPCATTPCQHGGTCLVTRHAMPAWWPMCKPTSSNILRVAFSHFSRIR